METSNRLLTLPREIRDTIYGFVVFFYDTTKKIAQTAILRTCRQTRSEAYVVMLKRHQLIRITVNHVLLSPHLIGALLHIVPMSEMAMETYPGFIMTQNIEGQQDTEAGSTSQPWSFALPWRDLGMFCRAVSSGHVFNLDAKAEIRHQVTMHDPFTTTCSPEYMSLENQTKFLQPYHDYLGSVAHFNIIGNVNINLAASLRAEIQKMPPIDATKMLEKFTRQDATGQRLLLGRHLAKFSRSCLKALVEISRLVDTDAWLESGPGGRPNEHFKAVRDMFNILSREHGASQWEGTQEDHTWHLSRAIQAAASLLAERAPSAAQKSSVYYLNAKAHRYFSGSPAAAESMLQLALDVVAGEAFDDWKEQCLEEGQEIARWRAVRNGRTWE
ncbi:hypothetical protein UCDDA912_g03212 [Diaporthe ampelina]|uniref:Uncharacterized protein n=1 Tax=Diaporthe ampelina TaxID=1214573 RepID=A0A0G2FS24_9PEZI|nr:hypothetical protein UCDDA912_g03212 [Diaporthe ampelina]